MPIPQKFQQFVVIPGREKQIAPQTEVQQSNLKPFFADQPGEQLPLGLSQVGQQIQERLPQQAQPFVKGAVETTRDILSAGLPGLAPQLITQPERKIRAGVATVAPVASAVGLGAKVLARTGVGQKVISESKEQLKDLTPVQSSFVNNVVESVPILKTTKEGINIAKNIATNFSPEDFQDLNENLIETSAFMGELKLGNIARRLKVRKSLSTQEGRANFSNDVRQDILQSRRDAGKDFRAGLESEVSKNPNKGGANLEDLFDELKAISSERVEGQIINPGMRSQINTIARRDKTGLLSELIKNPVKARKLNALQVQEIKNSIELNPTLKRKLSVPGSQFNSGESELLRLADDVRIRQADAFQDVADLQLLRANFSEKAQAFDDVKTFLPKRILGKQVEKGFSGTTDEIKQSLFKVMSPEIQKQIKLFSQTLGGRRAIGEGVKSTLGLALRISLAGAIAGLVGGSIISRSVGGGSSSQGDNQ